MYIVTSFGLVYLTRWFGHYGLWTIIFPVTLSFLWGVRHFEKLEGLRPDKTAAVPNDEVHSHAA